MSEDYLTLKWGSLKSWNLTSEKSQELLKKFYEDGVSMSAMMQHNTENQKDILCQIIDECGAEEIYLDWDDKYVSKEDAKQYVMEYGNE